MELGPRAEGLRVVREGLTTGDRVVVNGIHRVRDGAVVNAEAGEMLPIGGDGAEGNSAP